MVGQQGQDAMDEAAGLAAVKAWTQWYKPKYLSLGTSLQIGTAWWQFQTWPSPALGS